MTNQEKPLPAYRVKHGGLMRCCLASLDNAMCDPSKNPPKEGDIVACEYEKSNPTTMRFRDGAWEWNRD